jgi:hypothetical protein
LNLLARSASRWARFSFRELAAAALASSDMLGVCEDCFYVLIVDFRSGLSQIIGRSNSTLGF